MTRPANPLRPVRQTTEQLAAEVVEGFRTYQANCRCPKCHAQKVWCTECDWCRINMAVLAKAAIDRHLAVSSCVAQPDQAMIAPMSKTTGTKKKKASRPQPKAKAKTTSKPKAKATSKKKPASVTTIYDRQVFVRFDTPQIKEAVRKQALAANLSLSAYIGAAAVRAADEGWKPELKPVPEKKTA
jgi:hypothetical protein